MKLLLLFVVCVIFNFKAVALDFGEAKVEFSAPTNLGMVVHGEAKGFQGVIRNNDVGEAEFELKRLDTGLNLRNKHMLEDLHADVNPKAFLKWHGFIADLTLNGVTKTIALIREGKRYNFEVNLPDFGVRARRHLGVGIKDVVTVVVQLP